MRLLTMIALFGLLSFSLAEDKKTEKKEDKKEKKEKGEEIPVGKFVKKANNLEIGFEFTKDKGVIFTMDQGDNGCKLEAKAKFEKGGVVKCKTEKFDTKGNFPVQKEKGYEFSFKFKVDGKKIVISDLEGADINDEAREVVGGEYESESK